MSVLPAVVAAVLDAAALSDVVSATAACCVVSAAAAVEPADVSAEEAPPEDEEPQPASIVNAMAAVNATLNICFFFMIPSFRKAPGIPVQTEMPVCRPLRIFPLS